MKRNGIGFSGLQSALVCANAPLSPPFTWNWKGLVAGKETINLLKMDLIEDVVGEDIAPRNLHNRHECHSGLQSIE